jgi:hypothetical protein
VTEVGAQLSGRVLRLDVRRRVATVALPSVGRGRSFSVDYADPGEGPLVMEWLHGTPGTRSVGSVVAVRPGDAGTEVDLAITGGDAAWQRVAAGDARVSLQCRFAYADGPDPRGGRVERVDIG